MADSRESKTCYRWAGEDLLISVLVQPRASHSEIVGIHGEQLRVRLTAPPVDSKANQSLVKLLSEAFVIPRSRICIEKGHNSRSKLVRITRPEILPQFLKNSP